MQNHLLKAILVSLCFIAQTALADIWAERGDLSHIEKELSALEALVFTAKSKSNPEDRMTFNYPQLINDLRKIRSGIVNHLDVPMEPILPSSIEKISTNYTEQKP